MDLDLGTRNFSYLFRFQFTLDFCPIDCLILNLSWIPFGFQIKNQNISEIARIGSI